MKLVVTGATGFVGRCLVRRAAEAGHEVTAVVRSATEVPFAARVARISALSREEMRPIVKGADGVVHCAARVHVMRDEGGSAAERYRAANTTASLAVAEASRAADVDRFIFLSTAKVHGEGRAEPYRSSDPLAPVGAYAESKAAAEAGIAAVDPGALGWTIIRPPLVYGPEVGGNFRRLLSLATLGATVPLPLGGLDNRRSLVSVTNLVDAILGVLAVPATRGKRYLISDREDLSTTELLRRLGDALGRPVRLFTVPEGAFQGALSLMGKGAEAHRLLGSFSVDSSALWGDLGKGPTQTTEVALAEVAQWWLTRARA